MTSIKEKIMNTEENTPLGKIKEEEDSQSVISEDEILEAEKDASNLKTHEYNYTKQISKFTKSFKSGDNLKFKTFLKK